MGILNIVLLVFFVVVAVLLVLLVLLQTDEGDGLGGIFAGGSSSAFGSRSGNVLTRATTVLGSLFLILSLGLALMNRTPGGTGVEAAGRELSGGESGTNWLDEEPGAQDIIIPDEVITETETAEQASSMPLSLPVWDEVSTETETAEQ